MAYAGSEPGQTLGLGPDRLPAAVKLLISGGFGVGKTTMVGAVSEVPPLRTEEIITQESQGIDDLTGVEGKTTTTVALDFGRITLSQSLVLYLFGTPGQDRFWFMWDELALGAIGAIVLADPRRLADSFPAIDYFEVRGMPFVVAVNCFDGVCEFGVDEVADALDLDPHVPVVMCDARARESGKHAMVALLEHVMAIRMPVA